MLQIAAYIISFEKSLQIKKNPKIKKKNELAQLGQLYVCVIYMCSSYASYFTTPLYSWL